MIRLMVVDDDIDSRKEAVAQLADGELIEVVGEAGTSDEAWQMAKQLLPTIILLDLHLPGFLTVQDLLKRLCTLPNAKVIMYASNAKVADVQDWLEAGACGYRLKAGRSALRRMTILMVSRGSKGVISASLPRYITRLTYNERMILRHLTKRGKLKKAAERLGFTEDELTEIAMHLAAKVELDSVDKLINWAKKHGF